MGNFGVPDELSMSKESLTAKTVSNRRHNAAIEELYKNNNSQAHQFGDSSIGFGKPTSMA